jgi:enhancer of polycomb-like protein
LQQAINAAQAAVSGGRLKEAYIPTPPTIASDVQYDVLYPARFEQPATYIRSSATVEDHCNGSLYCMDEADEIALQKINAHLPTELKPCTEDNFEEVMGFFEETAQTKQPYASVDNAPVLPLEEFEEQVDETVGPTVRRLAKFVYEHWKSRRLESTNHRLQPSLKVSNAGPFHASSLTIMQLETGQDTDDADPYVCFRRREARQARKTRHRDAQSAEKLRRLRKELEDARHIMALVKQREIMRKEVLRIDKMLFKQRADVKETKRKLGIKGDDEDLINQKVSDSGVGVETRLTLVTAKEKDSRHS